MCVCVYVCVLKGWGGGSLYQGKVRAINNDLEVVFFLFFFPSGGAEDLPVAVQRQKSAFPPNYVHSLDSSHMLMTAKACAQVRVHLGT